MALNGTELLIINHLLRRHAGAAPRVLSLGYPDLLIGPDFMSRYMPHSDARDIKVRPDSEAVATQHNFPSDRIFDARDFFSRLGASLDVVDFADLGHGEIVLNLNDPVNWKWRLRYDLIIDPGTIEHCFNVGTAMSNVVGMLEVGGFVYHQAAILFCNHGFYSLSPTFFVDFYATNGFDVAQPHCWGPAFNAAMDADGIVTPYLPIDHGDERTDIGAGILFGCYVGRKRERTPITWPIQYRYGNPATASLTFEPFIEDALAVLN
jgi:hypothetical protein